MKSPTSIYSYCFKITAAILAAALIAGCASQKPYTVPEGVPHATIIYNPFYEGALFLTGPVICSSPLGVKSNYRNTTRIAEFSRRSKPTVVEIPSGDNVSLRAQYYTSSTAGNITMTVDWEMPIVTGSVYQIEYEMIYGLLGVFGGARSFNVQVKKDGIPVVINPLPRPNALPCADINPK
ncbi:hypothetical protein [Paraherbaspirillum soli]|uniref:Lipoprotein n=1 Tax=Paraherbaspirillum soli TaxID=631222 RepID=A0ABW0M925_9BURK